MRVRRALGRGLALLLGVGLALELGLRLVGYEPLVDPIGPRGLYRADPQLGIEPRPGFRGRHRAAEFDVAVAIDARGVRDHGSGGGAAARVLSLGDSMAFGYGVEARETYAARLEAALAGVAVQNGGVSSYGPDQQAVRLARLADGFPPDLVLSTFLAANDLDDVLAPPLTERGGLVFSPEFAAVIDASPAYRLGLGTSQLLWTVQVRWFEWRTGIRVPRAPRGVEPAGPDHVGPPIALPYFALEPDPAVEAHWQALAAAYTDLREGARALGAELLVVHVPTRQEADPDHWRRVLDRAGLDPSAYDRGLPARRLAALCAELGVELVDLRGPLGAGDAPGTRWFPRNGHLTAEGHAVAAEALREPVRRALERRVAEGR